MGVSIEHLQIELSRTREALKRFVDWHELDHDAEHPEDIQDAYDLAITRAKQVITDSPLLGEFEMWYEHEFCVGGDWCRSKSRHNSPAEADTYCVEHGGGCEYRVVRVQHAEAVVRESVRA